MQRSLFDPRPDPDAAALAAALPPNLRLGTSSWAFPGWAGIVYERAASAQTLSRKGLAEYARHPLLRAVGLDRTHYAPIDAAQFRAHAAQVPADFRFLVKAHEWCTLFRFPEHPRYGARGGQENPAFLDPEYAAREVVAPAVEGLGAKLGVLLFQCAPQPLAPLGGAAAFTARLHRFLAALPKLPDGACVAVEVRNAELLAPDYVAALEDAGAVHCVTAHARMPPVPEQAAAARVLGARHVVVRWMLHRSQSYDGALERYAPFGRLVDEDPATRADIARLVVAAATASATVTVVINNKAEGSAPLSVLALARELAR
jgi:uncharacterized protein YecE (DUF72 family)